MARIRPHFFLPRQPQSPDLEKTSALIEMTGLQKGLFPTISAALLAIVVGLSLALSTIPAIVLVAAVLLSAAALTRGVTRMASFLLATYLAGLLVAGRAFALIGIPPLFLPDALLAIALGISTPLWISGTRRLTGWIRVLLIIVVVAGIVATFRGFHAGHEEPLKGAILGLYPLAALAVAGLLVARGDLLERLPTWLWYLPTVGAFIGLLTPLILVPAGQGLGLAVAGSVGVSRRDRAGKWVSAAAVAGALVLAADAAKRGPMLAVLAAILATHLATRGSFRRQAPIIVLAGFVFGASLTMSVVAPAKDLPLVGDLTSRVQTGLQGGDNEAANNVSFRIELWRTAIAAAAEDPLVGAGAGAPLEATFLGRERTDPSAGPHNSFIGYAFYAGYPAAIAVVIVLTRAIWNAWSLRHRHPTAPALFGASIAVMLTAMTNVAFETTYIGGLSWAILGAAIALPEIVTDASRGTPRRFLPVARTSSPVAFSPSRPTDAPNGIP